ncbi:MAG: SRPBCC family protein [Acidimicrobiia bacterium]
MAIEIGERFSVEAPIDTVWRFVSDPTQLVTCMPGASLDEVVDERTFKGRVRVKLGAVTSSYQGTAELAEVDDDAHRVSVVAQGRDKGGGTARGTLKSRLEPLPDGSTEVIVEGELDLTGRVMQVGRGMIAGVSHELFKDFAASAKRRLEEPQVPAPDGTAVSDGAPMSDGTATAGDTPTHGPDAAPAIRVFSVLMRTIWSALTRLFHRIRSFFFPER